MTSCGTKQSPWCPAPGQSHCSSRSLWHHFSCTALPDAPTLFPAPPGEGEVDFFPPKWTLTFRKVFFYCFRATSCLSKCTCERPQLVLAFSSSRIWPHSLHNGFNKCYITFNIMGISFTRWQRVYRACSAFHLAVTCTERCTE